MQFHNADPTIYFKNEVDSSNYLVEDIMIILGSNIA